MLYQALRARIAEGHYGVGKLLPTEKALCAELGASRYALREAMARLEADGLVRRRRGSGSTVLRRLPLAIFQSGVSSREDLLNYASATFMAWGHRDIVRTDGKLARRLGCDEARQWQFMRGVRFEEDGEPLALVAVYIDTERATLPEAEVLGRSPVYQWLEKEHGLEPHAVSQDIRATRLAVKQAEELRDVPEAPVLEVIRRYFDANGAIYLISQSIYRSRDFVLNHRFLLGGAP
ncbi:Transcriptional regulator, GntR family [Pseudohaliea rubra DSM 19751]|uniref:Transcriptional regulator, GntR family n=2 Tax=Pseudohaliea TaxID=1341120 RepID=A0A095XXQ6_9GAMM|nr:Transcriptional regulator, GntR family [Pseudohaliea rubra DSM 19751]